MTYMGSEVIQAEQIILAQKKRERAQQISVRAGQKAHMICTQMLNLPCS